MNESPVKLVIEIDAGPDSDETELRFFADQLRRGLLELDVDNVVLARPGPEPAGAKGGGSGLSDVLILSLSNSTVLAAVVGTLGTWIKRRGGRRVRIKLGGNELEVNQASPEEQAKLIQMWIDRQYRR